MMGLEQISDDVVSQLKLLACFDPANLNLGIKIRSDMPQSLKQAAIQLHQQGLITESDGGYLTPFGMTMVEHLQHLLVALKPL